MDKFDLLKKFIQKEVANTDDKYALTVNETQEVFKQAIKVVEEMSGFEIDANEFNKFVTFYKIMKIVEQVAEEMRSDKYIADMQNRAQGKLNKESKNNV